MKTNMREAFNEFEYRCLTANVGPHTDPEKVAALWEQADSREDFIRALRDDDDLRYGQACGILSKYDFRFIRSMIGGKQFKTDSDAGSVRLIHDGFSVLVPNGYGDGVSRVAVLEAGDPFNPAALDYFATVEGDFGICWYDCDPSMIALTVSGRFNVYFGGGFVVLVRAV